MTLMEVGARGGRTQNGRVWRGRGVLRLPQLHAGQGALPKVPSPDRVSPPNQGAGSEVARAPLLSCRKARGQDD